MASEKGTGVLMVFTEVPADKEEEYNRWYSEEHLGDVLAIHGVLSGAQYSAVKGGPNYLACYELESPRVVESQAFQKLRDNPSEWTKRMSGRVIGSEYILNVYEQIFPTEVSQTVAQSDMAPVLQIGRMECPPQYEDPFNEQYNTRNVPGFLTVPGVINVRRYRVVQGEPKYMIMFDFAHEEVSQSPEWSAAGKAAGPPFAQSFPGFKHPPGSPGVYKKISR